MGGVGEFALGGTLGVTTGWTGVGALAGGSLMVLGADQASTGLQTLLSGTSKDSVLSSLAQSALGLDTRQANLLDASINITATAGGAGLLQAARGLPVYLNSSGLKGNAVPGFDIAESTTKGAINGLGFTRSQLQHAFKHAEDFGITGNVNNRTLSDFSSAIQAHVDAAGTRAISGTFRGSPVIHHVNPSTGLNVIRDSSGNFLSGWKLSPQQLKHVMTTGKLGGG